MFNAAHLHLIVNHAPVIGFIIALIFAIVALFSRDRTLHLAAIWLTIGSVATGAVAYLTGEPAEEMIADMGGVSQAYLSAHMRWGSLTFYAACGVGLIAIAMLFTQLNKPEGSRGMMAFLVVLLLAANVLGTVTATLGGGVRHPEIHDDGFGKLMHGVGMKPEEREMLDDERKGQSVPIHSHDESAAGHDPGIDYD